jgi:retron-type reverse transcriptase
VSKSGQKDKPFTIPKQLVWEAYRRVKANKGAAGVDRVSMEGFEEDLRGNLYKIWLCRVEDYAEWAALGADPCSSGVRMPVRDSA